MILDRKICFLAIGEIHASSLSTDIYGYPVDDFGDLIQSISMQGILVPLVVTSRHESEGWEIISGHRRYACAQTLGITEIPCEIRDFELVEEKLLALIQYNCQRRKTFGQLMREADTLISIGGFDGTAKRMANLKQNQQLTPDRRNSDNRQTRSDESIARMIGIGGKDLYRQARAVWNAAQAGDPRAQNSVTRIDEGVKTIFAAYKDLRRRDHFTSDFRPTPYDVWSFRHDSSYGITYPGSIPPAIVAHTLHYFTESNAFVVDPMAGGGTTLDVCLAMGRRCLAYDLNPSRSDIKHWDIRQGFPEQSFGCDLVFGDPPYHTMLAKKYVESSVANLPLSDWLTFLELFSLNSFLALRPGGYFALLLANQTEKDLPSGHGYLDHAFYGYQAMQKAGFLPQRRISCPMAGGYLPQHVKSARHDGRMLGQVRDLLIGRKPI
jgi:hypothetical protein